MKKIVLLVDDDGEIVDLLATLFLQNGWLPQRATCGEDAILSAARVVPHAVICDLQMPGISGFEVAEQFRLRYGAQCPAMIAFTACPDYAVNQHALKAGFDSVVHKPADFDQLMSAVQACLEAQPCHLQSVPALA